MTVERFPVEESHILFFARAIGDSNPAYTDPSSPEATALGGVIAPPTFMMAGSQFDPENPLLVRPGVPWFGSGREPSGATRESTGLLHAEQHFEYERPVRAGEILTTVERTGNTWEKESKRGGTLRFAERLIEYRTADTGELVVTVRMVTVVPSQVVAKD